MPEGINLKPTLDLKEAEQYSTTKLRAAEREDDERKAGVEAKTREPPKPGERPYIAHGRGRAAVHAANVLELGNRAAETQAAIELAAATEIAFETLDVKADKLEVRYWNAWGSVENADEKGRRRFFRTPAQSDYGNPSFDRNRSWWDQAAMVYRDETVTLPEAIEAFRAEILDMADRYGQTLDQLRSADEAVAEKWASLVALARRVRKSRRTTRSLLSEDFDGNSKWVDEFVPPLREPARKPQKAPGTPA